MASEVRVEQFKLSDQDALLSFLRLAYADEPRKSEPTYWRWHYLENPYTSSDDVPLWILKHGSQIVGQMATIPVELKVGNDKTKAIWILDFIILPEYRGQGFGKRLMGAARESYGTMIALGFNPQSEAVLRSHKWVALGGVHRYHRLLYPGNAFSEVGKFEPLRKFVNLGYAPFRLRHTSTPNIADGQIRQVSTFDAAFTDLWDRAATQWQCAVIRSPGYLEWQFGRQPGKQFEVLGAFDQERLLGYVVLFFRKGERHKVAPKVAISDICYDASNSASVIDDLLQAALHLALERCAGSMVMDILDPVVESRLKPLGFWRIKNAPRFMAGTSEYQDLIYRESNWFLTRGDSDVSIFEQPNL